MSVVAKCDFCGKYGEADSASQLARSSQYVRVPKEWFMISKPDGDTADHWCGTCDPRPKDPQVVPSVEERMESVFGEEAEVIDADEKRGEFTLRQTVQHVKNCIPSCPACQAQLQAQQGFGS